jgi:outer membrane protease
MLFAQEDFSFYAQAQAGAANLTLNETLLNNSSHDALPSSLLKWQIYATPIITAETGLRFNSNYFIKLNGLYALPFSAGRLQDYDWLNLFSTGGTEKTHYSTHKNNVDYFYSAHLSLGVGGDISDKVQFIQYFSFRYSYQSFTSTDGYRQYGANIGSQNGSNVYEPWTPDIPKTQLEGKIITLEEQHYFFGIGTQINFELTDRLNASLLLQLLPSIKSNALDTHHRRKTKYTLFENTNKLALDSSFLLQYKISDQHRLSIKAGYCYSFADGINLYQSATKNSWNGVGNPGKLNQHDFTLSAGYTYYYEK